MKNYPFSLIDTEIFSHSLFNSSSRGNSSSTINARSCIIFIWKYKETGKESSNKKKLAEAFSKIESDKAFLNECSWLWFADALSVLTMQKV